MRTLFVSTALASMGLAACMSSGGEAPSGPEGRLQIEVAPLSLSDIDEVIYDIRVNAPGANDALVWERLGLSSNRFGSGPNLTYVGPCDADFATNTVTVTVVALRSGGADLAASTWRNPGPVSASATCSPNADSLVEFNLAIMRSANQGFFDIAVNFDDIFCSAKLDCGSPEAPIRLVDNPAESGPDRLRTAVLGFSCTSGRPNTPTTLYLNTARLVCGGLEVATFDPSWAEGFRDHTTTMAPRSMRFRNLTNLGSGVTGCFWNQAIGFSEAQLTPSCRLQMEGTAARLPFGGPRTPADTVYPKIVWDVAITDASGALICRDNPLDGTQSNGQPSGVVTEYTDVDGEIFDHAWSCTDTAEPFSPGRVACVQTVEALGDASATETSRGIVVSAAGVDSPAYPLPPEFGGLSDTCCGDACCQ